MRRRRRILLLLPTTTYRADAFLDAASRLDVDLTVASEQASSLEAENPSGLLTLDWSDLDDTVRRVRAFSDRYPVAAVIGVDDDTALVANAVAAGLGMRHSSIDGLRAARDKWQQRECLHAAGVAVPGYRLVDLAQIEDAWTYPCVLKPRALSASRGVIRANDRGEFLAARDRVRSILESAGCESNALVEEYVPGDEVAVEGLVRDGRVHVLTIFDKPDPLCGPYFEETVYTTPSTLPADAQAACRRCVQDAVDALGLRWGPIHAELRNPSAPVLIELAARPIGGKCSRVLRFGARGEWTLEDVICREALGLLEGIPDREPGGHGVMMIPIPRAGVFRGVTGVETARSLPGISDVIMTAHRGQTLVPLPEGSQYLGFIFGHGTGGREVSETLHAAHRCLAFAID